MVAATYPYRPDYAVPPGWVLEEHLKSHSLSPAELARRCGRSAKLISPSLTWLPITRLLSTGYKGRNPQVALQTR